MTGTIESNGCSLAYKVEGSGEPVIFVQGVGLHGDGWLPQTQELRSRYRCLTFDNRGMGRSQPAGAKITMAQLAQDAMAVMDAAGMDSAHFVGHSLGGSVVLQAALTAPERVKSLALLCTSACGADATKLSSQMIWLGLRSRVGTRRMRANAFLEIVMPPEYLATRDRESLAEDLEPLFGHPLWDTPPVVMRQLAALKHFDVTVQLSQLPSIPKLVISAAKDLIFPPRCGQALAAHMPGARYVEVPAAAHGVPIQCPEVINGLLDEHFAGVETTRVPLG